MVNKKGISAIVAVVLTVLITVAGVAIIWGAVIPMISENFEFEGLDGQVTIISTGGYTAYDANKEIAIVQVRRGADEGTMSGVRVIFNFEGSSLNTIVSAPGAGQTITYTFNLSGYGEPSSVEVAPIFVSKGGAEKEGSVTSRFDIGSGTITRVYDKIYNLDGGSSLVLPVTGLVSWWKFDGDATDSEGANDGTCSSCPDYVEGAAVFDGVGDYVNVSGLAADFDSNKGAMSIWMKVDSVLLTDFAKHGIFEIGDMEDSSFNMGFRKGNVNNIIMRNREDVANYAIIADISTFADWHHVVGVWNSTNISIYDNGVLVDSGPKGTTISSSFTQAIIGADGQGPISHYFKGSLDDVMIYNRVLTEEEIGVIYEIQSKGS